MKIRLFKTVLILCILVCCVTLAGCGCGKKKTDPASEQVLKISIIPTPSLTPEPEQVDSAAVTTNGDVTMVNIYAAENPGVTTSTDSTADSGNTDNSENTDDSSSTDDSENISESDSSDQDDNSEDSYDSEDQGDNSEE